MHRRRIDAIESVTIYRLITENTVEENIYRKAKQKQHITDSVLDDGAFTMDFLASVNPAELLGYKPNSSIAQIASNAHKVELSSKASICISLHPIANNGLVWCVIIESGVVEE